MKKKKYLEKDLYLQKQNSIDDLRLKKENYWLFSD